MKQAQALQIITEEMPKAIATLEDHMVVMRAMKAAYGFEKWAKEAKNIELLQKSIEVKWVAQRLVGQSLTEMAKKGLRSTGRAKKGAKVGTPSDPNLKTLNDLGVKRKQSQDWQKIGRWSDSEFAVKLRWEKGWYSALVSNDRPAIKRYREQRNAQRKKHRAMREERLATEIRLQPGSPRFGVIVANIPWERAGFAAKKKNEKVADVETLDEKFIELGSSVDTIAADDCVLGLWCPEPWRGEKVLRAWGFEPKAWFVWVKDVVPDNKKYGPKTMLKSTLPDTLTVIGEAGTGYWNRDRAEILLIGARGHPVAPAPGEQGERVWFAGRTGDHEKPKISMEWFEQQYPNMPKVELYARDYRKGWASWGNDLPDGPRGLDDAANEALRMPQILSKDDKTPFDDEADDAA
jgi:N6-adenosine-specific RNA methylase IME4